MSDWVWVKETWNINLNSEVAPERQVNFLNQPGESWSLENALKKKSLLLCKKNYELKNSEVNWPPGFSNCQSCD